MNCVRLHTMAFSSRPVSRSLLFVRDIFHRCSCFRNLYAQNVRQENISRRFSYAGFCADERQQYPVLGKLSSLLDSTDFRSSIAAFAQRLDVNIPDIKNVLAALTHKSYLVMYAKRLEEVYDDNGQLSLLGQQTAKRVITEFLYSNFPEFSAQEMWDIQNGLLDDELLQLAEKWNLKSYIVYKNQSRELMYRQAILALVGAVYTHEGPDRASEFVLSKLIPELTKEIISELIKLQHPKHILRMLSTKIGQDPLKTKILQAKKSNSRFHVEHPHIYKVGVFQGDKALLAEAVCPLLGLAEKKACQKALLDHYHDDLQRFQFSLDSPDYVPEEDIDLGLMTSDQRLIELEKDNESFGFHIKGGENRKRKDEQWLEYHYFSPVFISHIVPDGPADKHGGLHVGDIILAVNDRSLEGLDHARAVKVLKAVTGKVTLTVKYSKAVIITDTVERKYKNMKEQKRLAELTSEIWAEWHQARANKNPVKYADVLKYEQNQKS